MKEIKLYHLIYMCVIALVVSNWLDMIKVHEYTNDAMKYHSFEMTTILYLWARIEQKIINKVSREKQ